MAVAAAAASRSAPTPATTSFMTERQAVHALVRRTLPEDEQPPPAFTPGKYRDPVYEKVRSAAQQHQEYQQRYGQQQDGRYTALDESCDKAEGSFLIE
ncbi:hypothetical protein WOLCODRAFT_136144 [Wolfiporia cocos MD-104 SS10]|uniref:Uncharacterized protein n=1 Tax=Wolfiporia cocos (strain MD-104) TaxID=742152 RepID=A0A2H3JEN6_WOLCO|nr:hypothetical protein WOLCODRAFT_136144 [Wolfiporia cocos MD-104 SS10]